MEEKHWELPAEEEVLDFTGVLLGEVDTDSGDRPRWTELQLYRCRDMWILYTIGHSVVYHAADGCTRGVEVPASDLGKVTFSAEDPDDLEPCRECAPEDWRLDPDARFRVEVTRYGYVPCSSAAMVIQSLHRECRECRHRPHEGAGCSCGCHARPGELTGPGRALLEKVKPLDPEIAAAMTRKVRF